MTDMLIDEILESVERIRWGRGSDRMPLLTFAFVVLKLCHIIDWSWWWVLSPVLLLAMLKLVAVLGLVVIDVIERRREKKSIQP